MKIPLHITEKTLYNVWTKPGGKAAVADEKYCIEVPNSHNCLTGYFRH
jgi:hypothetical protein